MPRSVTQYSTKQADLVFVAKSIFTYPARGGDAGGDGTLSQEADHQEC